MDNLASRRGESIPPAIPGSGVPLGPRARLSDPPPAFRRMRLPGKEKDMLRKLVTVLVFGLLLAAGPIALAQSTDAPGGEKRQAAYGFTLGYMIGDVASQLEQDGFQPELDDELTVGVLYIVKMSESTDYETRLSYSPGTMINTENGDVSTQIFFLDFTLIPHFNIGGFRLGVPFGLGWAAAREDKNFIEQIRGRQIGVEQSGGSGMTYYLGLRSDFKVGVKWKMFVDLRARRFHRLVNVRERTLKNTELAIGFIKGF